MRPCEQRIPQAVLQVYHGLGVIDGIGLTVSPVPDNPDRSVRIAVPGVQDIGIFSRSLAVLVEVDSQEAYLSGILVFVEQIQRERIIDIVAEVCLDYDCQGSIGIHCSLAPAGSQGRSQDRYGE